MGLSSAFGEGVFLLKVAFTEEVSRVRDRGGLPRCTPSEAAEKAQPFFASCFSISLVNSSSDGLVAER